MHISQVGHASPITRLHGSTADRGVQGSQDAAKVSSDTVEISDTARYLSEIKKLPDVREDKVAIAKARIASGYYDNPIVDETVVDGIQEDLRL